MTGGAASVQGRQRFAVACTGRYPSAMSELYHPPIKRSIEIAGHKTSISLEPLFWDLLRSAAEREGLPINAIVARIDAERIGAKRPPGLAGAIRLWLVSNELRPSA